MTSPCFTTTWAGVTTAWLVESALATASSTVSCDGLFSMSPRYSTVSVWLPTGSAVPWIGSVAEPSAARVPLAITASPSSSWTDPADRPWSR